VDSRLMNTIQQLTLVSALMRPSITELANVRNGWKTDIA
jgi:hypothetical protein